mgnify:CR=1 FL=1
MPYVEATAPTVIDQELCRSCIQLLQPKELSQTGVESESYRHQADAKKKELPFGEVECLVFSFKSARRRARGAAVARAAAATACVVLFVRSSASLHARAERAHPARHARVRALRARLTDCAARAQTSSRSTTSWGSTGC